MYVHNYKLIKMYLNRSKYGYSFSFTAEVNDLIQKLTPSGSVFVSFFIQGFQVRSKESRLQLQIGLCILGVSNRLVLSSGDQVLEISTELVINFLMINFENSNANFQNMGLTVCRFSIQNRDLLH